MTNTAIEIPCPEPFGFSGDNIASVNSVVTKYYPNLLGSVHACLAVFGAMALTGRSMPLSLILETPSGYGKTAVLSMAFPTKDSPLSAHVYRSDKFTPKAFVSHAANVPAQELANIDMLPRIENKVLITKEMAPIFRGREEELKETFSMLISVLDGKGFTSDTGMRGQRGYDRPILFNWIGATTPLPPSTHRLMSQLGTRLLFFEVPMAELTEDQLLAYAMEDSARKAETDCQQAVNEFLTAFFAEHSPGSVSHEEMEFSEERMLYLIRLAKFLVQGRAEVLFEKGESGTDPVPVSVAPAEGPFKVINYFKDLAKGHALIHGRMYVTEADLALVREVAFSSLPGHIRPIVRELCLAGAIDTRRAAAVCNASVPTARKRLKEVAMLGLGSLQAGAARTNDPDRITLADAYSWLANLENQM